MAEYSKQTWSDLPDTSTPLSAARLNHIENGLEAAAAQVFVQTTQPTAALGTPYLWVKTNASNSDFSLIFYDGNA